MDQIWIGYDNLAFTKASLNRDAGHMELVRDSSGVPLLFGAHRLYADPEGLRRVRAAASTIFLPSGMEVRSDLPMGHRRVWYGEKYWQYDDVNVDLDV